MKISDIPFLKHSLPLFYQPFPFDGKNLNPPPSPPFFENAENSTSPLYKGGGGDPTLHIL